MKKTKIEPPPSITGTWELLSLQGMDLTGEFNYPFDENPQGICFFDAKGNFSIIYNAPERPLLSRQDPYYCKDAEIRIAFLSTRSYYGNYHLAADTIILNIDNASFSNLSGLTMKYAYTTQGDTLQLISPKMRLNGQVINEYSIWYQEGFKVEEENKIKTSLAKFNKWVEARFEKLKRTPS